MKKMLLLLGVTILATSLTIDKKPTVYSIGDSTMCDYDERYLNGFGGEGYPIRGWMQMMPQFFTGDLKIRNMARSGRSTKSFKDEGLWKRTIEQVTTGDYVFIMFGPNDEKSDTARHTDPATTYRENMINYVKETRNKGANPILFTSICRRKFDKAGKLLPDTFDPYIQQVRLIAQEMNVPLIDINAKSRALIQQYGPEASRKLYLYIEPGRFTKLPDGKKDDTHLCERGATEIAKLAAEGLKEINSPLARYLK